MTDQTGRHSARRGGQGQLEVLHTGHRTALLDVPSPGSLARVELQPLAWVEAKIDGSAMLGAPESELAVALWRLDQPPDRESLRAASAEQCCNRRLLGLDQDGVYRSCGLVPGAAVRCIAATDGYLSARVDIDLAPGANEVALELHELHGAVLILRDQLDRPIRGSAGQWGLGFGLRCRPSGPPSLDPKAPELALAGLDESWASEDPALFPILVSVPPGADPPAPRQCDLQMPGYLQTRVAVQLMPLRNGLNAIDVRLQDCSSGWGWIELVVQGGSMQRLDELRVMGQVASLVLKPTQRSPELRYPLDLSAPGILLIGEIPFGGYRASVETSGLGFGNRVLHLDRESITVRDEPATLRLDLVQTGAVEMVVPPDTAWKRAAAFRVTVATRPEPAAGQAGVQQQMQSMVTFLAEPYRIPLLPAGTWEVSYFFPGRSSRVREIVDVVAGEIARLEIRPPD